MRGCKFFAIVDVASRYVLYFLPDERLAFLRVMGSDGGVNKYSADGDMSKTAAIIKLFVE